MRLGTGRPGTSARNPGEFNIVNRPMTQQGLGGVRMGAQGPGRMVMDRTFFLSELRQKISLLTNEWKKVTSETENAERENSNYLTFEKRADSLSENLRDLQGQLGDLNTLVDKLHTDADLEDIERQYVQIKAQNQRESHNVDDVFLQKRQKEKLVRELDNQIEDEKRKAEALISNLEAEKREEFKTLTASNEKRLREIEVRQTEMDGLAVTLKKYHEKIGKYPSKEKSFALRRDLKTVRQKREEQEQTARETASAEENVPQERERLLARVKEDNQEIAGMERKIADVEDQVRKMGEQIASIDAELENHQGERNAKYEELLKRDKDMQAFIDVFDEKKTEAATRNEAIESSIERHLEAIRNLGKQDVENLTPDLDEYKKVTGDLKYKEREMENSQNTQEAMILERDRRLGDLEKVRLLEGKLSHELEHLRERIATVNADLARVRNIDEIRRDAELTRARSSAEKAKLVKQHDAIRATLQDLNARYNAKKKQLHENETSSQLGALEQRLRQLESTNFHLKEFILDKQSESDYATVSQDVDGFIEVCNSQLIKCMAMLPGR